HQRAERAAAAAEQVDAGGAVAGAAGALLPVHLLAGAIDLGAVLHLVGAALALGELPGDAALDEIGTGAQAEDGVGELDRARRRRGRGTVSPLRSPPAGGRSPPRRARLARRRGLAALARAFRQAELARLRHRIGQLLLDRVAHRDPAALGARHRALDQDEAAL